MGVQGFEVYGLGYFGREAGRLDLRHPHALTFTLKGLICSGFWAQRPYYIRLFLGYFDAKGKVKTGGFPAQCILNHCAKFLGSP